MLRYVRIDDDGKRHSRERNNVIQFGANLSDPTAEDNLKIHLQTTVQGYGLRFMWTDLRWFAVYTAMVHGVLMVLVLSAIINDEASGTHRLKRMTTKMMTAWVGKDAPQQTFISNFGPNPRDSAETIQLTDRCTLADSRASMSAKFNTRQLIVESGLSASSVLTVGRSCGVRDLLLPRVQQRCWLLLLHLSGLCHLLCLLLLLLGSAGRQHLVSVHPF